MIRTILLILAICIVGCNPQSKKTKESKWEIIEVASFKGQQVTGVTVTNEKRIFANFPRWRKGVENSVVEIDKKGKPVSYPNKKWNSWEVGDTIIDSIFVAVQSVVAFEDDLYVLDTRNPRFKGVKGAPRVFAFDLNTNQLKRIYVFSDDAFHQGSYINDLRVDKKNQKVYFTDSGRGGLVVLDLQTGQTKRVLDNHVSTLAEDMKLVFNGKTWKASVDSDGIALDIKNDILYYHALTGYNLYAVPTKVLINGTQEEIEKSVQLVMKTPAPDGMIFDEKGNLYLADLENDKIIKLDVKNKKMEVIAEGEKVKWADTFSLYKNELFYTNSRIFEARGKVRELDFTINKIVIE